MIEAAEYSVATSGSRPRDIDAKGAKDSLAEVRRTRLSYGRPCIMLSTGSANMEPAREGVTDNRVRLIGGGVRVLVLAIVSMLEECFLRGDPACG
jgi:hypothetical protein